MSSSCPAIYRLILLTIERSPGCPDSSFSATTDKPVSIQKKPGFVAIKSVELKKLNKKLRDNLYSEIKILKTLHHPHIVALIDCQETEHHIHLIMEFCELGDLSYFIKKRDTLSRHPTTADMIRKYPNPAAGGLNEVVVRHFLKQLASALEFLQQKDFIHRDVKPQNLLLDPSPHYYRTAKPSHVRYAAHEKSMVPSVGVESLPTLKLADFGFARSLPSTSLAETLCGSPLYMAPEILRYEKYGASADLWSVGTVLYEMMIGKPPFRAANHVELLRKIERGDDRIRFPGEVDLSESMEKLIRGLLKKNPDHRMSFADFFNNTIIKDEIPGLVDGDLSSKPPKTEEARGNAEQSKAEGKRPESAGRDLPKKVSTGALSQSPRRQMSGSPKTTALRAETNVPRPQSGTPPRTATGDLKDKRHSADMSKETTKEQTLQPRRPSMTSHATAPARQDLHAQTTKNAAAVAMRRQSSTNSPTPRSPASQERLLQRERQREARDTRERAAQDVAFERDYVLIDKRNVEVNAFADELAASPRIYSTSQQPDVNRGAMVRRATTQNPPTVPQVTPSRAMQLAAGKPHEQTHHRQSSYERRIRDGQSATSAISKAINMASGRLFNLGYSPPLGLGRTGPSPPSHSPFPAYPTSGTPLLIKDGSKVPVPLDEDAKAVQAIEESATRSNVVYGFAEIKFLQLIPAAPSIDQGLGIQPDGSEAESVPVSSSDTDLDAEATVTCSEEALVLYVKALSLLARSMGIAEAWWARKNRGEVVEDSALPRTSPKASTSVAVGNRVNNVVQWVRHRFNEVLEKAEFVRLKLLDAQKQLPTDHPGHPSNHPSNSKSTTSLGASGDMVIITSGVTAETLMYDYALEKGHSAGVNEISGIELAGCEIDYKTAIWLLEAIVEDDDEDLASKRSAGAASKESKKSSSEDGTVNGVEAEDRETVVGRKSPFSPATLLAPISSNAQQSSKNSKPATQLSSAKCNLPPSATTTPPPLSHGPLRLLLPPDQVAPRLCLRGSIRCRLSYRDSVVQPIPASSFIDRCIEPLLTLTALPPTHPPTDPPADSLGLGMFLPPQCPKRVPCR